MKPQTYARGLAAIAIGAFAAITLVLGGQPDATWFRPASIAATIVGLFALVVDWAAPRTPMTRKLFKLPDLRGTWAATIRPTDIRSGATSGREVLAYVTIRQRLGNVTVALFTAENTSHSTSASITNVNESKYLAYTYRGEPKASVQHRSPNHYGAARLHILGSTLSGAYWTDRLSKGELDLTQRLSKKSHDGFDDCARLDNRTSAHSR